MARGSSVWAPKRKAVGGLGNLGGGVAGMDKLAPGVAGVANTLGGGRLRTKRDDLAAATSGLGGGIKVKTNRKLGVKPAPGLAGALTKK
jgi:hypothetical protein